MPRRIRALILSACITYILYTPIHLSAYPGYTQIYKEQLYDLYHEQLYPSARNYAENIYWLERILRADFANPLYALVKIETKEEWALYRELFNMHIYILLTRNYLQWGDRYVKQNVYFFNEPFKAMNLRSLEKGEALLEYSKVYWNLAVQTTNNIDLSKIYFFHIDGTEHFRDELRRIKEGRLDYGKIIERELNDLNNVRLQLESLNGYLSN